jgi:glutathione S-transferase
MSQSRKSADVTLIGADYSVYTRICRLTLRLKGVEHTFEHLDVFAEGGTSKAQKAGHPFGKIPILRHGDLTIFETLAITRYVDQAFDGPSLQPENPEDRALMNQIISTVDSQVYPVLVWGLHVPRSEGRPPAPGILEDGIIVLKALEALAGDEWLCGGDASLADAYLAGCMEYVIDSAVGTQLPDHAPRLRNWWRFARTCSAFA